MVSYRAELRECACEVIDRYFPNRESVSVRVDGSAIFCIDIVMSMSDDDYLADVLVYGKSLEEVEEEVIDHLQSRFVLTEKIKLLRIKDFNKIIRGNSNLIYAC